MKAWDAPGAASERTMRPAVPDALVLTIEVSRTRRSSPPERDWDSKWKESSVPVPKLPLPRMAIGVANDSPRTSGPAIVLPRTCAALSA